MYDDLLTAGEERLLRVGEVLVREGEASDRVFLVTEGMLHASVPGDDGEVEVGRVGEGEVVGEVASLLGLQRSATLTAVEQTTVVAITPERFAEWLAADPERAATVAAEARLRLHRVRIAEMAVETLGHGVADLVPRLLEVAEWVDVEAGSILFEQGDEPDAAYFLLSGRLQVVQESNGERKVLREIGPGQVVGELAVIQRVPRSATVRALRDATLARFPLDQFEELLTSDSRLLMLVVRRLVARMTGSEVPSGGSRAVAIAVVADGRPDDVLAPYLEFLTAVAPTVLLSSERVEAMLGRSGIAQSTGTDLGDIRLEQLFAEIEAAHDHLVLVTDPEPTPWTRRVLQRADTIVVVADAGLPRRQREAIESVLEARAHTEVPTWLALLHDPGAARPTAVPSSSLRATFDEVHHLRTGNSGDLARLARLSVGAGYGLVLGGGGAKGFAHLGVIKALRELGVPIDRIGGTSMGSIFAVFGALHEQHDDLVAACVSQFHRVIDYTIPLVSLIKAKRISDRLTKTFGEMDLEDTWIPCFCVSTNLTKSRQVVHRRGLLTTAVRASIAIPGVMPPVPFGEDLLVDGGVLNNVPADVMRADPSISTVVAVDVAPLAGPGVVHDYGMFVSGWQALRQVVRRKGLSYPDVGSVLVRTMITGSEGRRASIQSEGIADLYLALDITGVGMLEFANPDPVITRGYEGARPLIEEWLASGGETSDETSD